LTNINKVDEDEINPPGGQEESVQGCQKLSFGVFGTNSALPNELLRQHNARNSFGETRFEKCRNYPQLRT
jgi:hypothetical protein